MDFEARTVVYADSPLGEYYRDESINAFNTAGCLDVEFVSFSSQNIIQNSFPANSSEKKASMLTYLIDMAISLVQKTRSLFTEELLQQHRDIIIHSAAVIGNEALFYSDTFNQASFHHDDSVSNTESPSALFQQIISQGNKHEQGRKKSFHPFQKEIIYVATTVTCGMIGFCTLGKQRMFGLQTASTILGIGLFYSLFEMKSNRHLKQQLQYLSSTSEGLIRNHHIAFSELRSTCLEGIRMIKEEDTHIRNMKRVYRKENQTQKSLHEGMIVNLETGFQSIIERQKENLELMKDFFHESEWQAIQPNMSQAFRDSTSLSSLRLAEMSRNIYNLHRFQLETLVNAMHTLIIELRDWDQHGEIASHASNIPIHNSLFKIVEKLKHQTDEINKIRVSIQHTLGPKKIRLSGSISEKRRSTRNSNPAQKISDMIIDFRVQLECCYRFLDKAEAAFQRYDAISERDSDDKVESLSEFKECMTTVVGVHDHIGHLLGSFDATMQRLEGVNHDQMRDNQADNRPPPFPTHEEHMGTNLQLIVEGFKDNHDLTEQVFEADVPKRSDLIPSDPEEKKIYMQKLRQERIERRRAEELERALSLEKQMETEVLMSELRVMIDGRKQKMKPIGCAPTQDTPLSESNTTSHD